MTSEPPATPTPRWGRTDGTGLPPEVADTEARPEGADVEDLARTSEDAATTPSAPARRSRGRAAHSARSTGWAWLRETAVVLVSALALSLLIKTFLVQAFFIPSGSMEETLAIGDRVLVTKLAPGPLDVHRGDIVVFKDPGGWLATTPAQPQSPVAKAARSALTFIGLLPQDSGEHLIKRIIGMPGDAVVCCDDEGRVSVNGVSLDEPYLHPGSIPSEIPFEAVVPAGSLFVLGDNRQNSGDSRFPGAKTGGGYVPVANVVGVAFTTVWPIDRWTVLRNPGETFAQVPEPSGP